jgi:hypothetical protein
VGREEVRGESWLERRSWRSVAYLTGKRDDALSGLGKRCGAKEWWRARTTDRMFTSTSRPRLIFFYMPIQDLLSFLHFSFPFSFSC